MSRMKPLCVACGEPFSAARRNAGYHLCLECGEQRARQTRHTVLPLHKSNYMLVTDMDLIVGFNNKGGLVK